jgi:tryptophan synthase alpha chain
MSRIAARLERLRGEGRKALVPFFTAGDPSRESTVAVMHGLVAGGGPQVEVGGAG